MTLESSRMWRPLFVIGGIVYVAGGFQHPVGTMVEMLPDPAWIRAHSTVFAGLLVLAAGLLLFRLRQPAGTFLGRWLLVAIIATFLEAAEMAIHTMAYVDAGALALGQSTPVLTTHAWLATLVYPVFAVAMIGVILSGQRERSLGSPWIGWLGILGAAAHGIVMIPVFLFEITPAGILFPVATILLSLWFVLAGIWPGREASYAPASETADAV